MKPNRSREQIIAEMLELVTEPSKQTAIMFRANLSYTQLKSYLAFLSEKQLATQKEGMWVATEKGRKYLAAYSAVKRIFGDEQAGAQHGGKQEMSLNSLPLTWSVH
jgi:predicted transcriptional regulator